MANNSAIPSPVVIVGGGAAYSGNSFTKPWPKAFWTTEAGIDISKYEGGVDTLWGADIIRASGSTTADYNPATFFDVDDRLVPYDLMRNAPPWATTHSFFPLIA